MGSDSPLGPPLSAVWDTTFDTTLAYDYPTIEALLDHFESRQLIRSA